MTRLASATIQPIEIETYIKFLLNNWDRTVETETSYRTSISKSKGGVESRKGLWLKPRYLSHFRLTGTRVADTRTLIYMCQRMASETTTIPLFSDMTSFVQEDDTTITIPSMYYRFFENARCVIFEFNPGGGSEVVSSEIFEIDSVDTGNARIVLRSSITATSSTNRNRLIVPLIDAEIEIGQIQVSNHTDSHASVDIHAKEKVGNSGLLPVPYQKACSYKSLEVMPEVFHNWQHTPRTEIFRVSQATTLGRSTHISTFSDRPQMRFHMKELFCKREDAFNFISFFQYHKGRLRPFWAQWFQAMWTVANVSDTTITLNEGDRVEDMCLGFRYLALTASTGAVFISTIAFISDDSGSVIIDCLDAPPEGYNWTSARPCFMVRFKKDNLREVWRSGNACEISYSLEEVLETRNAEVLEAELFDGKYPGYTTSQFDFGEPGTALEHCIDAGALTVSDFPSSLYERLEKFANVDLPDHLGP